MIVVLNLHITARHALHTLINYFVSQSFVVFL